MPFDLEFDFTLNFLWVVYLLLALITARAAGLAWVEAYHAGGINRTMARIAACVSATSFGWCYAVLLGRYVGFGTGSWLLFEVGNYLFMPAIIVGSISAAPLHHWRLAYPSTLDDTQLDSFIAEYRRYAQINTLAGAWRSNFDDRRLPATNTSTMKKVRVVLTVLVGGLLLAPALIRFYAGSEGMSTILWRARRSGNPSNPS